MPSMKFLIILVLVLALAGALIFTRPTQADFTTYIQQNTEVAKTSGGNSVLDQIKNAAAGKVNETAADYFVKQCTFDNYVLFTNVNKDGKVIYTGALNHWFKRGDASASK